MNATTVKCKVDECVHYKDDYCTAEKIKVESQAGIMSSCTCCSETECSTFESKKK